METAQETLAASEAAAQASEAGHVAARAKLEAARAPLTEADKRVQRLETEAAHHLKARQRRDQEFVAADHRWRHRHQGL